MYSKPKFWRVTFIQHVKKEEKLNTLKNPKYKTNEKKERRNPTKFYITNTLLYTIPSKIS